MNRRRLEAEALRDTVLAAAGTLNLKVGGPPIVTPLTGEEIGRHARSFAVAGVASDPAEHNRRSVYLYVKRSFRLPMFETFDAPDAAASCARRESSTVAPQALALMNSEFMTDAGRAVRRAARKRAGDDPKRGSSRLARSPSAEPPSPERSRRRSAFLAQEHPAAAVSAVVQHE